MFYEVFKVIDYIRSQVEDLSTACDGGTSSPHTMTLTTHSTPKRAQHKMAARRGVEAWCSRTVTLGTPLARDSLTSVEAIVPVTVSEHG